MYHSQTYGDLELIQVNNKIVEYIETDPTSRYRIIIGADSQQKKNLQTDFVTAIIVHRIGAGAIYFWQRKVDKKKRVLKQRIYEEAFFALETAQKFLNIFKKNGIKSFEFEIHVDIGKKGPTREIINEVVGMIRGSGFNVKTKPEAYGASKVADRHA
jgi:predicted RNase H-related nuclease YkuK (DUF458 family)